MPNRRAVPQAVLVAIPLAALLAWSPQEAKSRIAGTFTATIASHQDLPVTDAPMHALALVESRGTNRSTGDTEYMAQGEIVNREISDLTQGTGPHQGYITFVQGADTTISRWSGKVTTVLDADHKPSTTMAGTWTVIAGTGRYRRATGSGTYRGRMLSEQEVSVDWHGELAGAKVAGK